MKVELTKKYAIHHRELPKGKVCDVSKELGADLIDKGVAVEFGKVKKNKTKTKKFVTNESGSNEKLDAPSNGQDSSKRH